MKKNSDDISENRLEEVKYSEGVLDTSINVANNSILPETDGPYRVPAVNEPGQEIVSEKLLKTQIVEEEIEDNRKIDG
jgi:hypothetical protein